MPPRWGFLGGRYAFATNRPLLRSCRKTKFLTVRNLLTPTPRRSYDCVSANSLQCGRTASRSAGTAATAVCRPGAPTRHPAPLHAPPGTAATAAPAATAAFRRQMDCTTPPTASRHPEPRRLRLLHSAFCILHSTLPLSPPELRRPRRRSWYFPANHAKKANENAFRNSRSFACLAGNPQSAFPRAGRAQRLTVRNLITSSRSTTPSSQTPQNVPQGPRKLARDEVPGNPSKPSQASRQGRLSRPHRGRHPCR